MNSSVTAAKRDSCPTNDANLAGGHLFLCILAYYVERQMRLKLAPLLFEDHD